MGVSREQLRSHIRPLESSILFFIITFRIFDSCREFVNCVQSIKILSSAEVQQMSLDGNFTGVPVTNQACSGGDSGNAWRGHYDDNSATSFNR